MRKLVSMLAAAGICSVALMAVGADDKEKTITGDATCAKCSLKETKSCQDVVKVTEDGKEVKYYMDPDSKLAKEKHKSAGFCDSSKKVKATGTVKEKDGKMIMTPTAIEVVES